MKKVSELKWALVLFILTLSPSLALSQATYVGSQKCMSCHKSIYETWKDTLHNKSQQILGPDNNSVVVDWKGTVKLKAGKIPEVTVKLNESNKVYQATLVDAKDPSKEVTYSVVRTYGGWGWKQRYQVKIGNNHYILPIQWNQATSRWVPYNLQNWYNEDGSLKQPAPEKSFEMNCAGCHNTGLELKKVDKGYESKYVELNTGCEKCHGPGSGHIQFPRAKGKIVNPRKMKNFEIALEVCGQCHTRGVSVPNGSFEFPWNDKDNKPYKLGEPLANYYQLKPGLWGDSEAHSKSHHQQWIDYQRSTHFQAKVFCFDCHNPHGGPSQSQLLKADYNNVLCLSCHGKDKKFANPGAIRIHTKHNYAPETKGTSRCSSCHLVKTASSAEAGDVHAHDFKIIKPHLSLEMFKKDPKNVVPNSCNGCHKDRAGDEAGFIKGVQAYESLFLTKN